MQYVGHIYTREYYPMHYLGDMLKPSQLNSKYHM